MTDFSRDKGQRLVGISGTHGAGKDTLGQHLAAVHGLQHVSTGDVLRAEATRRGEDITDRAKLREIAIEVQEAYGHLGAMVLKAIEQWKSAQDSFDGGLVISGIRLPAETEIIQAKGGLQLYIDADPRARYERTKERGRNTVEGAITFEEFIGGEALELGGNGHPGFPHLLGVKAAADYVIRNDGSEAELTAQAEVILGLVSPQSS
ncbi:MAG TPA: AAA family ATPase [Candidatus Saccharimonadales bacterium]|nr:AAA family ATPase [Candidatus Saccharimonadales bacterium]